MQSRLLLPPRRPRHPSASEGEDFDSINERPVEDITLRFFYRTRTLTLLCVTVLALVYFCLMRDETFSHDGNIKAGCIAAGFCLLIISVLTFPNGPFIRPHPALWRCVFGCSVLYSVLLVFIAFQDYQTARAILIFCFPDLKNFTIDMDVGQWGQNCDDLSLANLYNSVDFFCFAHFAGWAMKALLVRHYGVLWTISVMWEITEWCFCHLLPNFAECWWDSLFLDIILCNGLGIWFGMAVSHWMEMRYYSWESFRDIRTASGKLKRSVLQFTPHSWTGMRWLDPAYPGVRSAAVWLFVMFWQVSELNTFFLKHIFQMPPNHPLVFARIFLIGAISAPSIRQYYIYVTDPTCKRVGTQAWVYGVIMAVETIICVKFGRDVFRNFDARFFAVWLAISVAVSVASVYVCSTHQRSKPRRHARVQKARPPSPRSPPTSSQASPQSSPCKSPSSALSPPFSQGLRHRRYSVKDDDYDAASSAVESDTDTHPPSPMAPGARLLRSGAR